MNELERFLAVLATRRSPRTVDAYRRDLLDIERRLKKPVSTATTDELENYLAELRAEGLAATTTRPPPAALRSSSATSGCSAPAATTRRRRSTLPRRRGSYRGRSRRARPSG